MGTLSVQPRSSTWAKMNAVHHHHVAVSAEVVAMSLGAAFLYALTSVLQHRAVAHIPEGRMMRLALLWDLARRPAWLLTVAADGGAYILQFLALRAGSLLTVQTLLVSTLLYSLPLGAAIMGRRPGLHDWVATAV